MLINVKPILIFRGGNKRTRYLSSLLYVTQLEQAAGMRFTGIVNNSNIGDETTAREVLESIAYAESISEITGLPVKFTTVKSELAGEISEKIKNIMQIKICVKQSF